MYNESEALTVYQHLLDQTPTGPRIIEMGVKVASLRFIESNNTK